MATKDHKIQLIIEALGRYDSAFNGVKQQMRETKAEADSLNASTSAVAGGVSKIGVAFIALTAVIAAAIATAKRAAEEGIAYLARIETASLGIASAFMTGGKYIDETSGKALSAQAALNAAQGDAKKIIEELQYANLQTIATLDELINAYQVTLPVALAKGFDRQQVKDFTVAMVQAAGAIGLQMNMLGEETRSLLTGAIDPRISRIATVLGIRNEDIRQFKGNANELFSFLMDKLAAYRAAGIESQNTWAGLWSNFRDIISQSLGRAIEPLFDALKANLKAIADSIVTIDDKAKKIRWNPEFLEGVNRIREGLLSCIAEVYRLGMLLDKLGGSFSRTMHGITFSELTGSTRWSQMNDEYRARYMASEKALQDMAMRSMGYKPVTADIDKQMREAAAAGRKIYDQLQINVGGEEPGTRQLLRYVRPTDSAGTEWTSNPLRSDQDKGAAKLAKEWKKALYDLNADIAKEDLSEFEQKLVEIGKKAEELQDKFRNVFGAEEEISKARAALENNAVTEAAQKDFEEYLKGLETEKKIVEEAEQRQRKLQAARESEIEAALDELDVAEAAGTAHRETLEARIRMTRELVALREKGLAQLDKEKDAASWYAQDSKLRSSRKSLTALTREESAQTPLGAIQQSLQDLENKWSDTSAQLQTLTNNAAQGMATGFSDFFFDVMTGKLEDWRDYAQSIFNSVARAFSNMIGEMLARQAVSGLTSILKYLFNSTSYNTGGETDPELLGGMHSGGIVGTSRPSFYRLVPSFAFAGAPRLHNGLMPDEYTAILQKGEIVIRKDNVRREDAAPAAPQGQAAAQPVVININAVDALSLKELLRRNPDAVVGPVTQALTDNRTRKVWKKSLS